MPKAWYIDTLDALSGYAFASHRIPDLDGDIDGETILSDDSASYFIEAPQFTPERVSSRAIAFGAARGGFQTGLYLGENEVAFATLDAVAEFVRRAYGSGGGADEGGGGTPAARGPEGPERPGFPDMRGEEGEGGSPGGERGGIDPVHSLLAAFTGLAESVLAARETAASGEAVSHHGLTAPFSAYGETAARRLARAAFRLILEAVWFPEAMDADERWAIRVSRAKLHECISRMALWPHLCDLLGRWRAYDLAAHAVVHLRNGPDLDSVVGDAPDAYGRAFALVRFFRMWLCFGDENYSDYQDTLRSHFHDMLNTDVSLDRYADLAHVVIPAEWIPNACLPARAAPTLRNLIAFACHSPTKIHEARREEVCETLLFAAAYLNLPAGMSSRKSNGWLYGRPRRQSDIERELMDTSRMVAAAMSWLQVNLPRYLFHDELEEAIASTASQGRKIGLHQGSSSFP
jgi:hypothetical protein